MRTCNVEFIVNLVIHLLASSFVSVWVGGCVWEGGGVIVFNVLGQI